VLRAIENALGLFDGPGYYRVAVRATSQLTVSVSSRRPVTSTNWRSSS